MGIVDGSGRTKPEQDQVEEQDQEPEETVPQQEPANPFTPAETEEAGNGGEAQG